MCICLQLKQLIQNTFKTAEKNLRNRFQYLLSVYVGGAFFTFHLLERGFTLLILTNQYIWSQLRLGSQPAKCLS